MDKREIEEVVSQYDRKRWFRSFRITAGEIAAADAISSLKFDSPRHKPFPMPKHWWQFREEIYWNTVR